MVPPDKDTYVSLADIVRLHIYCSLSSDHELDYGHELT